MLSELSLASGDLATSDFGPVNDLFLLWPLTVFVAKRIQQAIK